MPTLAKQLQALITRFIMTTEQDETEYESYSPPSDQKNLLLLDFAEIVHRAYIA